MISFLSGFAALVVHIDGQIGEDEEEFLAVDLDGPERIQRMMGYERDARMLRLDEGQRMLITNEATDGKSGWISNNRPPIRYHVEALGGSCLK